MFGNLLMDLNTRLNRKTMETITSLRCQLWTLLAATVTSSLPSSHSHHYTTLDIIYYTIL